MMGNNYRYLKIHIEENNLTISLNRPEKRNALNNELVVELKTVFSRIPKENGIKTVTLTGEGTAFCSGADLEYLQQIKDYVYEKNLLDSRNLAELFFEIYSCPKPTIALVKGAAIAGGCGLATVCDFVLADREAKFGYPEVKIGFVAALVSVFLLRQIGERKTKNLLLTGNIINGEEAAKIGLINRAGKWQEILNYHRKLVKSLHNNSAEAMKVSKEMISDFVFADIKKELERMAAINASFRKTRDFTEGIAAFLEKRKPNWVVS